MEARKILLVDDDEGVIFLNRYMLKSSNTAGSVSVAHNGKDAMELIEAGLIPDVVFLDVNMPVMNGFEFLKELKTKSPIYDKVQVYMLTSSLRESDKAQAFAHSCVKKYFEKPLTSAMIAEVFGKVI